LEMAAADFEGEMVKKEFTTQIECEVILPEKSYEAFTRRLMDSTAGMISIRIMEVSRLIQEKILDSMKEIDV
jgi:hypothetical protein